MLALGMFTGVLATGLGYPLIEGFASTGARGAWTLPELVHAPYGTVVAAVVATALAGFYVAEKIEARR
jgi:hypothetical protein